MDKNPGYSFEISRYPEITLHLIIEMLAHQQAMFSHGLERSNLSESEKDELMADINAAVPELKEKILQKLYASFGKTPEI